MKRSNPFRVEQKVKGNQGNNNETMKGRLLQNKYWGYNTEVNPKEQDPGEPRKKVNNLSMIV